MNGQVAGPAQSGTAAPRYCANCGAPVDGGNFCSTCGAQVRAPGVPAPPGTFAPPSPALSTGVVRPHARSRRWKVVAAVWAVLLVVGGAGGLAYGFLRGPGPGPSLPSDDQMLVIAEHGQPPAFVVADGPLGPGEASARLEQWLYSDAGLRVVFVDGRNVSEEYFTPEREFPPRAVTPADFSRSMRVTAVEELLGESGAPVPDIETAFDGYEAYAYEQAGVIVGYLDGWLYTVQTY